MWTIPRPVRFYVHWKDEADVKTLTFRQRCWGWERKPIYLGIRTISWWSITITGRLEEVFVACHSGDVRHRKRRLCEYMTSTQGCTREVLAYVIMMYATSTAFAQELESQPSATWSVSIPNRMTLGCQEP